MRVSPLQHEGHRPDRADVQRHVFAPQAVAARCGAGQLPGLVRQGDGQAVDLRFADHREVVAFQHPGGAPAPRGELLLVERVAEAEHRAGVRHLVELGGGRRADALRRRAVVREFRVCLFQRLQFPEERVVLSVGDERGVEDVIEVVVAVQLLAQFAHALGGCGVGHLLLCLPSPSGRGPG